MKEVMYAHLYVEHYCNGSILLDFMLEEEFLCFKNVGDYYEDIHIDKQTPTMLLFNNIGKFRIQEGNILTFLMKDLIYFTFNRQSENYNNELKNDYINIAFKYEDGEVFSHLYNRRIVSRKHSQRNLYTYKIEETWDSVTPCALANLYEKFKICVMDVRQGSANLIYDNDNLTVFDFGTSIYSSKTLCNDIISKHLKYFKNKKTSLIISHLDCDHYNLLSVVQDSFLEDLCCAFVPNTVLTLTAKQVVSRFKEHCRYIKTFTPPSKTIRSTSKMQILSSGKRYILFIGEKDKSKNKSGLALTVFGKKDAVIISADHTNQQVWEDIYFELKKRCLVGKINIVVPHHGGKEERCKINLIFETPGVAAISVGKNAYKHPSQNIIDMYNENGFKVKRTDWEREDIIISIE